ncbi:MAG: TorF family putative porin [Chromatiales bacterium]|nr:TorF family putative porin [Chromatiales bacterium]
MTKLFKKAALSSAIAAALLASGTAMAEVEFNIGATSNYLWRGLTQTEDGAAIQGGIDYSHDSGFYAGAWTSNVKFGDSGYELDGYFGFGKEFGDLGVDVGYIYYAYPTFDDSDFGEIYANLTWKFLSGGVAYTSNAQDAVEAVESAVYYYIGASTDIPAGLTLGGTIGHTAFDDDSLEDYSHFQISLGKSTDFGDFALTADKNDIDGDDDPRVSVSWTKTF